jgi:hypothetical protein
MKPGRRQQGKGALELLEEATHLLRTAPVAALAAYYLGALPFVLGLLFYWADMSRNPFARQHLADASLAMGVLFLWMKCWQVIFARRLRLQLSRQAPSALGARGVARIILTQTILQPPGLFLIPLSLVPALPFAWLHAFYQNVTALADGEERTANLFKRSWRQASLWPMQNNFALLLLFGFAVYVFLNWVALCFGLPQILKMLFGVESVFTRSPASLLNTTFFAAMGALTYLAVDPLLKAFYVLRCFYGEALQSGEDLKAELRPFVVAAQKAAAALFFIGALLATVRVGAEPAAVSPEESSVSAGAQGAPQLSAPELDRVINETIHERKYAWRMPRARAEEKEESQGLLSRFLTRVGNLLRRWIRAVARWLEEWLRKLFADHRPTVHNSGYKWIMAEQLLLWGLVAAVVAALILLLYRVLRQRSKRSPAIAGEAIFPVPDLADENVGADQLPEDGWLKLGRELLQKGEYRVAMRAFYLASLAHLAARNLVRLARFKSNRDYEHELRRRAHSFPELLAVFGDNISVFERIWYGTHEASLELVNQFASNVERLQATL